MPTGKVKYYILRVLEDLETENFAIYSPYENHTEPEDSYLIKIVECNRPICGLRWHCRN